MQRAVGVPARRSTIVHVLEPRGLGSRRVLSRGLTRCRPGGLTVLREVIRTEVAETSKPEGQTTSSDQANGNGLLPSSNGYSSNGNGNGAYSSNGNGNSSNGNRVYSSNGNGVNGNGKSPVGETPKTAAATIVAPTPGTAKSPAFSPTNSQEEVMDACSTGALEACAATSTTQPAAASSDPKQKKFSAEGTPYKSPGGRWSKFKSYSTFQRTLEIWMFAIQFAWKYFKLNQKWTYGKEGMITEAVSRRKGELAVWLREGLVKLGPTFIKIGQQFSTRVDVLAPEFVKELEKLQDNVPPFETATAIQILENSLGKKVDEVFEDFSQEPIAAASLGQVHLAKLKGETVVVKIQRPGLKSLFDIDLKNIRALAVWLQKVDPKTDGAARDWVAIYDECSRILYEEIDYKLEGKNADRFRENFKGVDWVKVPEVYWDYSSSEVLVLEFCPGIKINNGPALDLQGLDRKRLARLAVESYLQQILRHGFFHADPHPGNVAVDKTGRLVYYDFGMMGTIPGDVRGGLSELFYGAYNKDPERCLDALIAMGVLVPTGDRTAVRRTADFFLKSFQERLEAQRKEKEELAKRGENVGFKPQRSKEEAAARRKAILSSIGEDLLLCANDQPFRFPATFTFVVRSFTVLDGIGKSLDPRFDISEISAPYARELLLEAKPQFAKIAADLKKRSDNQNRAVVNLFKGPNNIDNINAVINRLENGDLKLRVRALEAERALTRVQQWQKLVVCALAASTLVNMGTVLSVSAMATASTASFAGAAFFGLQALLGYFKISKDEKREKQLAPGAAL